MVAVLVYHKRIQAVGTFRRFNTVQLAELFYIVFGKAKSGKQTEIIKILFFKIFAARM